MRSVPTPKSRLDEERDHAHHRERGATQGKARRNGRSEPLPHREDDDDVDIDEIELSDELDRVPPADPARTSPQSHCRRCKRPPPRSSAVNDGHDHLVFARIATAAAMNTASVARALNGNGGQSMAIVARKRSSNHRRMGARIMAFPDRSPGRKRAPRGDQVS